MAFRTIGLLVGGVLGAVSLAAQSPPAGTSWPIAKAPAELRYAISRADLVIVAMQDALLRELTEALTRGGPATAMKSCHIDVTSVSQRIGRYEGIAAGRTSHRLRNPTNTPRPWAADIVKAHAGQRAQDVEGFAVDLGDRLGVLRPIVQRSECAGCHGPADRLQPVVREALADRYPADRALGFKEGEIRGWFWVEISKSGK